MPREGHDLIFFFSFLKLFNFNPRAPRGARPLAEDNGKTLIIISIHVPREGHDCFDSVPSMIPKISIHVPREGHDDIVLVIR